MLTSLSVDLTFHIVQTNSQNSYFGRKIFYLSRILRSEYYIESGYPGDDRIGSTSQAKDIVPQEAMRGDRYC